MKKLLLILPVILLCGFTYGYKNNPQTGKPDLVTTGVSINDVTGSIAFAKYSTSFRTGSAAATTKSTPVTADFFTFWDSITSGLRKLTWGNIVSTLNALYQPIGTYLTSITASLPIVVGGTATVPTLTLASVPFSIISTSGNAKYVPYTGAISNVNLNAKTLSAASLAVTGTAGAGYETFIAQSSNPTSPPAGTLLIHSSTNNGFTRMEQDNEAPTNLIYGRDNVAIAKNTSGSTINAMQPVYVTGSTGNVPNIGLAKANSTTTLPAMGIALDSIANNAFGQVMRLGVISNVNTSAYSVGDSLWVSQTTAGSLVNVRPPYPNYVQRMATVLVSGVGNGSLLVVTAPFVGGMESGTTSNWQSSGTVTGTQLISNVATGTAPLVVTSTTPVANLQASKVTTNANLTGPITSSGNATSVASQTGTGSKFVMDTAPTLITPNIGVATATNLNVAGTITTSLGTNNGAYIANEMFTQYEVTNTLRTYVTGANASTYGQWLFYMAHSDGSGLVNPFTISSAGISTTGTVTVNNGANTVYRCTGATNLGMLTINSALCVTGFATTSLKLD